MDENNINNNLNLINEQISYVYTWNRDSLLSPENTDFENSIKNFLKLITKSCDKYIDNLFNKEGTNFSYLTCSNGDISKLYKYLENFDYKKNDKNKLKKELYDFFIQICRDPKKKEIIKNYQELGNNGINNEFSDNEIMGNNNEFDRTTKNKKYTTYEDYDKIWGSNEYEKEKTYNDLSPINQVFAYTKKYVGREMLTYDLETQVMACVNNIILKRYEQIAGFEYEQARISKKIQPKNVDNYDEYDKLIKKIYVENEDSPESIDKLKKKIALDFCLRDIKKELSVNISKLQKSINDLNTRIINCNELMSKYQMEVGGNNFTTTFKNPIEPEPNSHYYEPFNPTGYNPNMWNPGNGFGTGGNSKITKISKKEILGKERCIYKISGDKKQYLKHKGELITITEYKKIMAAKNKK